MIYTIKCPCGLDIRPEQMIGDNYCVFCKNNHYEKDTKQAEGVVEDNTPRTEERTDNEVVTTDIKPVRKKKK